MTRVRETLRLMQRDADERVTRTVAREIAQREQLKALVAGSIASLGSHYVLALEAINAASGDVMAREQVEVARKEEVLTALGKAAKKLREQARRVARVGSAIRRPAAARDDRLARGAARLFAGARPGPRGARASRRFRTSKRAIELDPDFAMAQALLSGVYANNGRSAEAPAFSRRAFELRDRVSERERFFISWRYYIDAAQAWDKALDAGAIVDRDLSARSVRLQQPRPGVGRVRSARRGGARVPRSDSPRSEVRAAAWQSRRAR